jgi:hypothetical protein
VRMMVAWDGSRTIHREKPMDWDAYSTVVTGLYPLPYVQDGTIAPRPVTHTILISRQR